MTKTNKTLLCVLLALVMTFALALTALTVADTQTAKAEGENLVATFDFTDLTVAGSTEVKSISTTAGEYTISATTTKVYVDTGNKLKFGSSSARGSMSFTVQDGISKIEIDANTYSSDSSSIKITVGDTEVSTTALTSSTTTVSAEIGTTRNVTIDITGKRGYVTAIRYYTAGSSTGGETTNAVGFSINGTKLSTSDFTVDLENHELTYTSKESDAFNGTISITNTTEGAMGVVFNKGDTYDFIFLASVTEEQYTVKINDVVIDGGVLENGTIGADVTELAISIVLNCDHSGTTKTAVSNGDGTHKLVCDTCKQEVESSIACTADTTWHTNSDNHWHLCTVCGAEIEKTAHAYSEGVCECGAEEPQSTNYTLVTDVSQLVEGDKIIIVGGSTYTLGEQADNNFKQVAVSVVDGKISIPADSTYTEITVGKSGEYYTLSTASGYLYAASSGSNYLKTQATVDGNAQWTITISNGVATIKANGTNSRKLLKYNSSSKIFSCYASGQGDVKLYKVESAPEVPASKFEIEQSITAGAGSTEGMVETENGEVKTIYVAPNGQIVVTYNITKNEGINTFIGTLNYDKNLFQIVSVTVTDIFGEGSAIKSGKYDVDDFKVYVEGDGTGFNKTATGEFIVVTYKYIGTTASVLTGVEFGFVEGSVECYANSTSGYVNAEVTVNAPAEKLDLIKTAEITLNEVAAGGTVSVTYNAKALTVNLELNNPSLIVRSDNTGKIVTTWYSDAARQNKIDAPTTVGTYYLTVVIESNGQYAESTADFTIVIKQYEIDYDALQVIASPNNKALSDGTATWADNEITIEGLSDLPDQTGVYTVTYGTKSFDTVGDHTITVKVVITNANYKFVSKDGFATGDSETVYNGGVEVSVSAKAIDLVLPELADKYYDAQPISLAGITASVEGEELEVSIEIKVNDVVVTSENIASYIVNAGSYKISVRAWIEGNANYKEVTGSINVTIKQLTLYIDESMLTYDGSTVSWENVVKAYKETTADTVDLASFTGVTVSYKVTNGSEHDYDVENNKFDANSLAVIAQLTLQAIPSDTVNFKMSGVELEMVYAVTFAASTTPEVAEKVVKVFNNQPVADPKTQVEGYRLAGWYLPEAEDAYKFDTLVTGNITLTAKWVKLITITWYAEDGTTVLKTLTADIDTTATYIDDTHTAPTKDATTYIDYAFNKWVAMNEAATEYDLENVFTLTEDIEVKASFTGTVARMTVKYVVVYGNGTAAEAVEIGTVNVGKTVSEIGLPELAKYTWFTVSAWMNGETEFTVVEADALNGEHTITLTATYVFAIGNGDVDGNGKVEVADITLYRQYIVGGYEMEVVTDAWATAVAGVEEGKTYFIVAVANVDGDEAGKTDIRDVSTIRMALVGGYGYDVKDGAVVKGTNANTLNSARSAAPKQVLAPMGLFGKKFAL